MAEIGNQRDDLFRLELLEHLGCKEARIQRCQIMLLLPENIDHIRGIMVAVIAEAATGAMALA